MSDDEFEEQLRMEEAAERAKDDTTSSTRQRIDSDGTVYEWDTEKRAWFPKIDADFLAQYQMNYGEHKEDQGEKSDGGSTIPPAPANINSPEYREWYYKYYPNQPVKLNEAAPADMNIEDVLEHTEKSMENEVNKQDYPSLCAYYQNYYREHYLNNKELEDMTPEEKTQYEQYWKHYADYYYQQQDLSTPNDVKPESNTEEVEDKDANKGKKRAAELKKTPEWFEVQDNKNTNVYVTGLPEDITHEEYEELMKKYGLIMFDPFTKKPKLKLYKDANGVNKGDGLCGYIKQESVELALDILDGSEVRGHKIYVERAKFERKGEFDPAIAKKKKLNNKQKRKLKERQQKLFDWRPDDDASTRQKHERIIVVKNLFDPKSFENDPTLINDVREDLRSECSKYGEVKKIIIYDHHYEGVATVAFTEAEEADMCVKEINNRYFAKRIITAATWDGKTKYDILETEEEKQKRLKKWEDFIEGKG